MAQRVKGRSRSDSRARRCALECSALDVSVTERRAPARCEHEVAGFSEGGSCLMHAQKRGELGHKRRVADPGASFRRNAAGRSSALRARQLRADMDHAGGEIDVCPCQGE
jgi:hypothetical protein